MKIRVNPDLAGRLIAFVIKAIGRTLRFELEDRAGLGDAAVKQASIWLFWHNRMFVIPLLPARFFPHQTGSALTSASGDGAIIAAVMKHFGFGSVRGSSSRRGAAALLELASTLKEGRNAAVTPDGPRGPVYKMGPGAFFLARQTGFPILPIHVEYSRAIRLKSWDRFMIPLPFSKVRVVLDHFVRIPPETDPEAERARVEQMMQPPDFQR